VNSPSLFTSGERDPQ